MVVSGSTYEVRAAMRSQVSGQCDGGAEAEENAQSVQNSIDDGDLELVDEGSGEEVEESEEPPDADEE